MPSTEQNDIMEDLSSGRYGKYTVNAPLAHYAYWKIGGPADLLIEPQSIEQIQSLIRYLAQQGIPYVVIGDGCNMLFDDAGLRGVVVRIGRGMAELSIQGELIEAQGGVYVPWLARKSALAGLTGLEHTIGIPGTLGGLVLMNGGSLRKGIGDNVVEVEVVTPQGDRKVLSREECQFSYRHSALQGTGNIVVRTVLKCEKADKKTVRREMLDILRQRRRNFPLRLPNCGSVFLNDPDIYEAYGPPGKVVEDTGLKGLKIGDIQVSPLHANFMVNLGNGRSRDVLNLIRTVRERVFQRTGFWLTCEVRYIAPDGQMMQAHVAAGP